jgi:hypothetical protein
MLTPDKELYIISQKHVFSFKITKALRAKNCNQIVSKTDNVQLYIS